MSTSFEISNYYYNSEKEAIFEKGHEATQHQALKAVQQTFAMLQAYSVSKEQMEGWAQEHNLNFNAYHIATPFDDPFFVLLTLHLATHPTYSTPSYGGGGCSGSDCSGGDGKACATIVLVAILACLVVAVAVAIGFTIKHGIEADKVRSAIDEARQGQEATNDQAIQQIYRRMLSILREQYTDKVVKTLFSATTVIGFGCLTAATALALYAILAEVPFLYGTSTLAITGASVTGAGLLGHAFRPLVNYNRKSRMENKHIDLFVDAMGLLPHLIHPNMLLEKSGEDKAYIIIKDGIFYKDGDHYGLLNNEARTGQDLLKQGYKKLELEIQNNTTPSGS